MIVELSPLVPDSLTNDSIQAAVYSALISTNIELVLVGPTCEANIILLINSDHAASLLEPYFESIFFALRPLGLEVSSIRTNSCCSKFILHNVPTYIGNGHYSSLRVAAVIKEASPQPVLRQSLRCLTRRETRQTKTLSSIVFATSGN